MPHMVQQLPPICKNYKQFSRENLQHFSLRWLSFGCWTCVNSPHVDFLFQRFSSQHHPSPIPKAPAALPWRLWQTAAAPVTMRQWHPWTPASERRWCFCCGPSVSWIFPRNPSLTGWWYTLPLWKMMDFVSWDDDIPKIWKNMEK